MNTMNVNLELDFEMMDNITIQNLIQSYNSIRKYSKVYSSEENDSITKLLDEHEDNKTIAALEHVIEYYGTHDWRNKYKHLIELT